MDYPYLFNYSWYSVAIFVETFCKKKAAFRFMKSAEMPGSLQSNDVFVAGEEQDCSQLGQDHSRKIRAKPVRISLVFFGA